MDKLDNEIHVCEHCGKEHDGSYGSGRFCSEFCARAFSTKSKRKEINKKVSKTLQNKFLTKFPQKFCKDCGKQLERRNKSGYCNKCIHKHIHNTLEAREKQRQAQLKLVKNEQHQGWKTRNISSYPENFWKTVLDNNHIEYAFNYPIPKKNLGFNDSACYFLDFKIGNNIDLEIDGKQHQYEERKNHDKFRDEVLTKHGWKVYRIPWNEINSENGKEKMKKKIIDFLIWYKSF